MAQKRNKDNQKLSLSDLKAALSDQLPPDPPEDSSPPDSSDFEALDPIRSPLQVLITEPFREDDRGNELADQVLAKTKTAEKDSCKQLYKQLCDRTALLADELVTVKFSWRLRVGGTRGFRELILPVFHPIYGIPYVPSSSLKGFLRAWAREAQKVELGRLLGFLDGDDAAVAAIQILDAFPTAPCLELDMANPQWAWKGNRVQYGTVPHPLLSMAEVTLKIGLVRTSAGTKTDVGLVKNWLEQAFKSEGLGARVSAGYGQASRVNGQPLSTFQSLTHPHSSEHPFEFWSQGIYGQDPNKTEFRPVAARGILRYWFRAVALGLYSPDECRTLEKKVFGGIEPKPEEGSFKLIATLDSETLGEQTVPHSGTGTLILQAREKSHLILLQALLKLAFHVGGLGRGARRPLHWNSGRLRGCFWQPIETTETLPYDTEAWQAFFLSLLSAFDQVRPENTTAPNTSQPVKREQLQRPQLPRQREANKRTQDILNSHARIYLIRSRNLKHPNQVREWRNEGDKYRVRGTALDFFYASGFKGVNRDGQGNPNVGGKLEVPSFVWIQSNRLNKPDDAYQVVTLFGADHPERKKFLQKLQDSRQIRDKQEIVLPWV